MKQLTLIMLIALFFSCGNDDDASINQNPETFNVTATADIKGLGIRLVWDVPTDLDGDTLLYDVMVGSTLITENITTPSHVFNASAYNTVISGNVIAKDGKGGETNISFNVTTSSLVNIVDPDFEAFLINANIDSDGQINGQMDYELPLEITSLDIDGTLPNMSFVFTNLTGIESFVNLESLNCSHHSISNLDVSRNTVLERLTVSNTNLTSLDLSNNTKLKFYTGSFNNITTIDFSKNVELIEINLSENLLLTELDLTENIELTKLDCTGASLTTLDLTENIELTELNYLGPSLTTIDVSNNTKLQTLRCSGGVLNSLDLSNNLLLELLSCSRNNISTLNLSANINLKYLSCFQNNMSTLNLSQNNQLERVFCFNNDLTSLNIKNGNSQNIQEFNAKGNPNLTSVCIDVLLPVSSVLSDGVDTGVSFSTICN